MIKLQAAFFITCIYFLTSSLALAQNYTLAGNVDFTGFSGKKIYLVISDRNTPYPYKKIDSTIIQRQNLFHFDGEIPYENSYAYLTLDIDDPKNPKYFIGNFILDGGQNVVKIQKYNSKNTSTIYKIIDNSKTNLLYNKIALLQNKYFNLYATEIYALKNNGDSSKIRVFDNYEKQIEQNEKIVEIIIQNPANYYGLIELYGLAHASHYIKNPTPLMTAFNKLSTNIRNSKLGKVFKNEIAERIYNFNSIKIGEPVILFSVLDDKNNVFNNSSLSGHPYIIAFSATWCIPCKAQEKELKKINNNYKKSGLSIVYFNLDDNTHIWKERIKQDLLNDWFNVSEQTKMEDSKIAKNYFVNSIPTYFLVSKSGKIIYKLNGVQDTDGNKRFEDAVIKALE